MISLRVLKPFGLWNAGELAGFHPDRAAELVPAAAPAAAVMVEPEPQMEPQPDGEEPDAPATTKRRKG